MAVKSKVVSRVSTAPKNYEDNTNPSATESATQAGDFTDFLKMIAKNPALITGYSKILKNAGYYKGSITGKYSPSFQQALINAEEDRASINIVSPISREEFLNNLEPIGGSGRNTVVQDITAYTPESAKMLIDSIIKNTLGRKATKSEIKKYTSELKSIQSQSATTTTYNKSGGIQTRVVSPGIDEKQYLLDQVAGTDEGKANKVLGFYDTFMNALGGR
jgi:hypothetical protein